VGVSSIKSGVGRDVIALWRKTLVGPATTMNFRSALFLPSNQLIAILRVSTPSSMATLSSDGSETDVDEVFLTFYDGPEAQEVFSRSQSWWEAALCTATSTQHLPEGSCNLEALLFRTPSLPNTIPSNASYIEGFSMWRNSDTKRDPKCRIDKRGKSQRFVLRNKHPIICRVSSSSSFSAWKDTPNNGIALLVLGWAYILTAELVERQNLKIQYVSPLNSRSDGHCPTLRLDYALPRERAWWKAIASRGTGWSITGDDPLNDKKFSPWAVQVEDLGLDIADAVTTGQPPPSAREAACYLARLCRAFRLGSQCTAALAAVLGFPLHAYCVPRKSATVELAKPSLTFCSCEGDRDDPPSAFHHIDRYMALSASPIMFGSLLWSIFWEPGVPCNFAGAWLRPIDAVLRPIIESNNMELLAKVLSFTNAGPLWLGITVCGGRQIIDTIGPYLTNLTAYPHTIPNSDSAAWTGIAQSFLHIYPHGPYLQPDGTVSRADVWRLRHDCYYEYQVGTPFKHAPLHGWPPFGRMQEVDVELEIRPHLRCSHLWEYCGWTWSLPAEVIDMTVYTTPLASTARDKRAFGGHVLRECQYSAEEVSKVSREATEIVFRWAASQVEAGFAQLVSQRIGGDGKSVVPESPPKSIDRKRIEDWVQQYLDARRRSKYLG